MFLKKFYVLSFIIALFFTAGCTKNYKTVDEYIDAMQQQKAKYNNMYTIDATVQSKEPGKITEGYYRTNIKNGKWKLDSSEDEGETFSSTMLFDGKEVLIYSADSPYAMVSPISMMINLEKDPKKKEFLVNIQNPLIMLVNWEQDFDIEPKEAPAGEFINNKDTRNGFTCRMIQFGSGKEVCVDDKTGIAVYLHMSFNDNTNKHSKRRFGEITINLKHFDTSDIPDTTFELPKDKKKMSFESLLQDMTKSFKNLKNFN